MGKNSRHKLYLEGSITVEAAFIVPILLGIIFMIIFVLFLFHDRIVLQENANRALYCMAEGTISADSIAMRKETENALWAVRVKNIKIAKKRGKISGKVEAETKWDIPIIKMFLNERQEVGWEGEVSCIQPDMLILVKQGPERSAD